MIDDTSKSVCQLAAYWHCSQKKVRHFIRVGRLRAINIGLGGRQQLRITPDAIAEFEQRLAVTPKTTHRRRRQLADGIDPDIVELLGGCRMIDAAGPSGPSTVGDQRTDEALRLHQRGCWVVVCCDPSHEPGKCIVPRKTPCHSPGKAPIHGRWQSDRLTADQIRAMRAKHPGSNIGVKWGEESGLIDVEADTPEAENALQELLDEAEFPELRLIPTYSSRRGFHRVFKFTPGLPNAVVHLFGIEFRCGGRGKGAQSVVPPSTHASGIRYQWVELLSLDDVEPPELPPHIVKLIRLSKGVA